MRMRRVKNRTQVLYQLNGIIFPSTEIFWGLTKRCNNYLHPERKTQQKYKMEQLSSTLSKAVHEDITAEAAITKQLFKTAKP